MEKIIFSWSSGKDSALALYEVMKNPQYEILALLTTVTEDYDRISMHGVRRVLLEQQANALDIPLEKVFIPRNASNDEYEANMRRVLTRYLEQGVTCVAFGDIFLEDLRKYREENLGKLGMRGIFPLWKRDTNQLFQDMIGYGFKAITTCVDTHVLGKEFVGREIDAQFFAELPETVDPCGENGEFHSFAFDGPVFPKPIAFEIGEKTLREERFYYCDLIPVDLESN